MQAGAFFGALLAYPLADKYGRKPGLLGAAVLAAIGGVLQAAAGGHLEPLYIGRAIEGLGLGAATMLTPTYLAENSTSSRIHALASRTYIIPRPSD